MSLVCVVVMVGLAEKSGEGGVKWCDNQRMKKMILFDPIQSVHPPHFSMVYFDRFG